MTQTGVDLVNPERTVNPLCNIFFTAASSALIIGVGWFLTDVIVEPRLRGTKVDGDPEEMPQMESLSRRDQLGMWCGLAAMGVGIVCLALWA